MTSELPPAERGQPVAWGALVRRTVHRTSKPTDREIRTMVGQLAAWRRGRKPNADAVLLGALNLVRTLPDWETRLAAEVRNVEAGRYDVSPEGNE